MQYSSRVSYFIHTASAQSSDALKETTSDHTRESYCAIYRQVVKRFS